MVLERKRRSDTWRFVYEYVEEKQSLKLKK